MYRLSHWDGDSPGDGIAEHANMHGIRKTSIFLDSTLVEDHNILVATVLRMSPSTVLRSWMTPHKHMCIFRGSFLNNLGK